MKLMGGNIRPPMKVLVFFVQVALFIFVDFFPRSVFDAGCFKCSFFAKAQDIIVHSPSTEIPVGSQFILNFTVNNAIDKTIQEERLTFDMQPFISEASYPVGPGARRIVLADSVHAVGNHVIHMDSITAMAANPPDGVASVSMKESGQALTDILHNSIVLTFMLYRPATNPGQTGLWFSRANFLFRVDTETEQAELRVPTSNQGIAVEFSLQFALPEEALPGSLFLNVYPTDVDTNGKRRIQISNDIYQVGVHSIDMSAFSTLASTSSDIAVVSPAIDMVKDALYTFGFEYRDKLGNPAKEVNQTGIFHDTETLPPVVIAPSSGARIPTTFTFTFRLPENALNQSVILDIAKTNTKDPDCPTDINDAGYCPDDDNADRRIVFMGNFHAKGDHTFTVPSEGLDSLASSNSNVLRITPNVDLVHGQQYMMIFRYRDYAANAEESTSNIVIFDSKTISPVLNTPLCGNRVPPVFQLSFTIEETALPGSVALNMTRLSGYSDPDMWRAVTFSSLFEVKGMYTRLQGLAHSRLSLGACATELSFS